MKFPTFPCCGKKPEGEKKPKKPSDRKCTDIVCLVIFILFLGILGAILAISVSTGDWASLVYEADYMGNRCGVGDYATKPKAFYPRIPRDMFEQKDIIEAGSVTAFTSLRLYALCVASCPTDFNIENPESSLITDYGYSKTSPVTQALGSGTQELWLSATPTVDIFNRCIPRTESSSDRVEMCAYPKCTSAEAVAVGAVCETSGGFPNGSWPVCPSSEGSGMEDSECTAQKDVCKVRARETTTMTFELATSDEASAAMLSQVANSVGGLFEIMSSISSASVFIGVGGIVLPIALAFLYMFLLFMFAKIIIYSLLVMLVFSQLLATFVCFSRSGISFNGVSGDTILATASATSNVSVPDAATNALGAVEEDSQWIYAVGFLVLAILTVITIVSIVLARRKIAIVAAIVKEATTVFISMPMLMFFPSLSTLMQIGVCFWFIISMVLVQTTKPESIDVALDLVANTSSAEFIALGVNASGVSVDPIEGLRGLVQSSFYQNGCFLLVLFGFFTLIQFVQGIAWCTMSGAVYYWYYFFGREGAENEAEQTRVPIFRSLTRVLFYHTGSVAFAAFVIAICDMLRAAASYAEAQMGPTNNFLVKLAFKVLQCCLYCLKKTVKFVSYYGLVFVACTGNSFCMGCYRTFFFFLQNPGQVAINATVTMLLRLVAVLSCPLFCGVVFYYIIDGYFASDPELSTLNAMYPGAIITILASVMTVSCMTVFECTITTIFVCCFQDKAEFGGKYMSDRLAKAFHIKRNKDEGAVVKKEEEGEVDAPVKQSV
jgi:choline transporter-like protein 2/4/5